MPVLIAFMLCLAGFAGLSLSMKKHARDLFGPTSTIRRRTICRIAGWALLALSVFFCVSLWGVSIGCVAWFGFATVAALAVAMGLTYARPDTNLATKNRREGAR